MKGFFTLFFFTSPFGGGGGRLIFAYDAIPELFSLILEARVARLSWRVALNYSLALKLINITLITSSSSSNLASRIFLFFSLFF